MVIPSCADIKQASCGIASSLDLPHLVSSPHELSHCQSLPAASWSFNSTLGRVYLSKLCVIVSMRRSPGLNQIQMEANKSIVRNHFLPLLYLFKPTIDLRCLIWISQIVCEVMAGGALKRYYVVNDVTTTATSYICFFDIETSSETYFPLKCQLRNVFTMAILPVQLRFSCTA